MIALQFSFGCFSLGGGGRQLERETERKGKREGQEPRLLANLGRRKGANSFAPSNRIHRTETIPGNLLFLLPPPTATFFFFFQKNVDKTL